MDTPMNTALRNLQDEEFDKIKLKIQRLFIQIWENHSVYYETFEYIIFPEITTLKLVYTTQTASVILYTAFVQKKKQTSKQAKKKCSD